MKSMEILRREHAWIRHLLDCLSRVVDDASSRGRVDTRKANELMRLFEVFAEGTHQDKEENHLFPRLLAHASLEEEGQLRQLFEQHEGERQRMLGMCAHLTSAMFGGRISVPEFVRDAREYIDFHRQHMAQEGLLLFPMGDRVLTDADDAQLLAGFGEVEESGKSQEIRARIGRLCADLGVATESGFASL